MSYIVTKLKRGLILGAKTEFVTSVLCSYQNNVIAYIKDECEKYGVDPGLIELGMFKSDSNPRHVDTTLAAKYKFDGACYEYHVVEVKDSYNAQQWNEWIAHLGNFVSFKNELKLKGVVESYCEGSFTATTDHKDRGWVEFEFRTIAQNEPFKPQEESKRYHVTMILATEASYNQQNLRNQIDRVCKQLQACIDATGEDKLCKIKITPKYSSFNVGICDLGNLPLYYRPVKFNSIGYKVTEYINQ